ncbi:MAG: hypothetical protein K2R98_19995 [Gemmataceae bacterium]|nr:hypothetical protein [Gemmataceae bacterium]
MYVQIIWDLDDDEDGNVQHIAEHGVTKEEVASVLQNRNNPVEESDSSGRPSTFGWTHTGRYIIVVWELANEDPRMVYPVTAYAVPEPGA